MLSPSDEDDGDRVREGHVRFVALVRRRPRAVDGVPVDGVHEVHDGHRVLRENVQA